jgi:hypothetical protein
VGLLEEGTQIRRTASEAILATLPNAIPLQFSPDGRQLLALRPDRALQLWNLTDLLGSDFSV